MFGNVSLPFTVTRSCKSECRAGLILCGKTQDSREYPQWSVYHMHSPADEYGVSASDRCAEIYRLFQTYARTNPVLLLGQKGVLFSVIAHMTSFWERTVKGDKRLWLAMEEMGCLTDCEVSCEDTSWLQEYCHVGVNSRLFPKLQQHFMKRRRLKQFWCTAFELSDSFLCKWEEKEPVKEKTFHWFFCYHLSNINMRLVHPIFQMGLYNWLSRGGFGNSYLHVLCNHYFFPASLLYCKNSTYVNTSLYHNTALMEKWFPLEKWLGPPKKRCREARQSR